MANFGEIPLYVSKDEEGVYHVAAEHVANAEPCGVPETFEADRLEIMRARALAHGYLLGEQPENHTDPALPAVTPKQSSKSNKNTSEWHVE